MNKFIFAALLGFSSYFASAGINFSEEEWSIIKTTAKRTSSILPVPCEAPKYQGSKGAAQQFLKITRLANSYFELLSAQEIPKKAQRDLVYGMCTWSFAALSGLYLYSINQSQPEMLGIDERNCSNVDCGMDRQGVPLTAYVCETDAVSSVAGRAFNIRGTEQSVFCVPANSVAFQENELAALKMDHCEYVTTFDRDCIDTGNSMFPSYFYPALSAVFNISCPNSEQDGGMNISKTIEECLPFVAASSIIYPIFCAKNWLTSRSLNKKYTLEIEQVKKQLGEEIIAYTKIRSPDKKFFLELLRTWIKVIDPLPQGNL